MAHAPKAPEDFSPRLQFRPQVPEKIVEVEMRVPGNRRQKVRYNLLGVENYTHGQGDSHKKSAGCTARYDQLLFKCSRPFGKLCI